MVTTGRTTRPKTKRRTGEHARRSSRTAAPATSDEKTIAQLTRELGESLEREKATSRELSESLERETATSQVLGIISGSPTDLNAVFETILANATRLCDASYGTLWLSEGAAFRAVALHGPLPSTYVEQLRRGVLRPGPDGPVPRAARTRQTVHVADFRAEQAYVDRHPLAVASAELAGIRTLLVVPMLKQSEVVGLISIYRQKVRPFTDKQIAVVQNFAAQAVIAIENARLLNELRESLEQQTATSEVRGVISSSPSDLRPVFETILANATRLCEAQFGILYRYDGNVFHLGALHNVAPALAEYLVANRCCGRAQRTHMAACCKRSSPFMFLTPRRNQSISNASPCVWLPWNSAGCAPSSLCRCSRTGRFLARSQSIARKFVHLLTSRSR